VPAGYERFAAASRQRKAAAARDAQLLAQDDAPSSAANTHGPLAPLLGASGRALAPQTSSSPSFVQACHVGRPSACSVVDAAASASDSAAAAACVPRRGSTRHTIGWGTDDSASTAACADVASASVPCQPRSRVTASPLSKRRLPSTDLHASPGDAARGHRGAADALAARHAAAPPLHPQEDGDRASAAPRFGGSVSCSRPRLPSADALGAPPASERARAASVSVPAEVAFPDPTHGRDAAPSPACAATARLACPPGFPSAPEPTLVPALEAVACGDRQYGMAALPEASMGLPSPLVGGAPRLADSVAPDTSSGSSGSILAGSDPAACSTVALAGPMQTRSVAARSAVSPATPVQPSVAASGGAQLAPPSPLLLASPTAVGEWSHLSPSPGGSPDGRPSAGGGAGPRPAADARTRAFAGQTALVVDDSDSIRLLMARAMRTLGFACDTAENGAAAVAKVATVLGTRGAGSAADSSGSPPAASLLPAVVLMDKTMPVLGGIDATKQLREAPISYRGLIIGVTGDAGRGDQQDFIRAGADAVLPKPLVKADLIALLHRHLTAAAAPALPARP